MFITSSGCTDAGPVRQENEDAVLADDGLGLYVVADGMGGPANGKLAAETAVKSISSFIQDNIDKIEIASKTESAGIEVGIILSRAIQKACGEVYQKAQSSDVLKGMGTTISVLLVYGRYAMLGHVGNCRLYLVRNGIVHQLSKDHTAVQEMIDHGALAPENAANSPFAHVLSRAVGSHETVIADKLNIEILPHDVFVLCSDELSSVLKDRGELGRFITDAGPGKASSLARGLVELAASRSSSDNISAVTVSVLTHADEIAVEKDRAADVTLRIDTIRNVSVFRDLEMDQIMRFVDRASLVIREKGEKLFNQGDPDDSMYVILSGEIGISSGETEVSRLTNGNHLGEMAWLDNAPRSAAATATKTSRLLKITGDDFKGLLHEDPVVGMKVLSAISRELSARLRIANSKLGSVL